MNFVTHQRLKNARLLGIKGFKTNLAGWGIYIVATIMLIFTSLMIMGYHGSIQEDGLLVTGSPLNFPFYLVVIATGIYLAIMTLTVVARERESGTLEVLFYGPVDTVSYITGKFLENLFSFWVMLTAYLIVFLIFGLTSNFGYYTFFIPRILLASIYATSLIALGAAIAIFMNSIRTAVLALIGILIVLTAIQWARPLVPEGIGAGIMAVAVRISPFYNFDQGLQALANSDGIAYLISFGLLTVLTLLLLSGAVAMLARKGVKQK